MIEKLIYESKKSKIYFRNESEWGIPVIIKVLNYEFPTPQDILQFENEFEIISSVKLDGIRNALKKGKDKNRHALFLEWVEGENLNIAFKGKQNDIVDFLHIAIATADALSQIHSNNIIHKDINPFNILVNLQERRVHIIDFGISTNLDLKQQYVGNPELLEGTLAYNSPEQTGRMNRIVDYRTDLYSLGITMYEMLAGNLPYISIDAMELVHAHIAQTPRPLTEVNPNVPPQVWNIIAKLLSKNAENRYQSAYGLKNDFEKCLEELQTNGRISLFPLGMRDFSERFQLPQKLYGREHEIEAIISAFDKCANGASSLLLVKGFSGTGKSALIHEVYKPITAKRGYFISGKFDQFQRATPYYAITEAFKELINVFLTENEERLSIVRDAIKSALGEEGKVLTNVLPNLEYIIGKQNEIPEIGGTEAQNRFNYIFRKFVNAVCTKEHPLVVFIDDLQWADSASLNLLKVLMTDAKRGHMLCIGAYRDNEVSVSHPAMITIDQIRDEGTEIETISIGNLSEENVNDLVADAMNTDGGTTSPLTRLVYEKTQGNAFFVTQFLKSVCEEKLVWFDLEKSAWLWSIDKISEKNITDNVVLLMTEKILRLPSATQEVMKTGACIGNSFTYEMLALILQKDEQQLKADLFPALKDGLLIPFGQAKIKFSHDRIQQAVYFLIPDSQKSKVHLDIGRLLLKNIAPEHQEEKIFDIVNQLNSGIALVSDEGEKEKMAHLDLLAGRKAKQNSAFLPSFEYLTSGITLLKQDPWNTQYDLCLQLHSEACEAAYLNGEFAKMELLYHDIILNAKNILEKVKPYEIRINAYKAENKLQEAIDTGLELLAQLGERFPRKPNMLHVGKGLIGTLIRLRGKNNDYLMNLPIMSNEIKIAAMRIIADITPSVYWGRPNLLPLLVFRMVGRTLEYGNTAVSCFAFGSYGVINCGVLGFMKTGNEFGKLALNLLDKLNAKEWKAQIYVAPYALTFHWRNHVRTTLAPLQESFQIGMETGLIEFACVNTNIYCIHAFLCGKSLERTEEETNAYSRSYHQFKQETNYNYNEVYRQAMLNFMGKNSDPVVLTGTAYNEDAMLAQNIQRNDKTGTFFIHFLKTMLACHFHEPAKAKQHAEEAEQLLDSVMAKFEIPNLHFYHALSSLALIQIAPEQKQKLIAKAKKCHSLLEKWAKDAPMNFQHKADLILAELFRIYENAGEARMWYDKAIAGASEQEFLHEEALAYELAGRFYIEQNSKDLSEYYLKAAYNAYREWGAEGKLRHLEQNFPKYVAGVNNTDNSMVSSSLVDSKTSMVRSSVLDISTVLKAATSISEEVVHSRLLSLLIKIVIENAGAQRGLLLLQRNGELFIEAKIEAGETDAEILQNIPLDNCNLLAESIVKFSKRTGEKVLVQDALNDARYKNDEYIVRMKPRSIICLPIINHGKFTGIIYLENNLTTGAFTQNRVNILSLLSGQIAVSIDNSMLYNNLEQKVQERTLELANEKKKTDALLYNILPKETADELKEKGYADARYFDKVTILFTDFKGFTSISEKLSPQELVQEIDECFRAFDLIMEKYNIEKIKTIGDSYMAAGGLPVPNSTHAEDVVKASLEIRDFVKKRNAQKSELAFEIRIGINTGGVVAGIVGTKKFQYDIWGDAVNTASRMESSGEPGKVNISQNTYELVKNKFNCSYRGEIEAKGKGKVKMYFIESGTPQTLDQ